MSQIQIRDTEGEPLILINVRLSLGHKSSDEAYDDKFSDFSGNLAFPVVLPSTDGYTLWVNYADVNENYVNKEVYVPGKVDDQDILIILERESLPRAVIDGYYSNVFFKGESGFLDLCRRLNGQDISPVLKQSSEVGSRGRRVFLMTVNTANAAGLPPLDPDNYPNFYDELEWLLGEYERRGMYLYASIFPDNGLLPNWANKTPKQVGHWNRIGDIAKRYPNFWGIELTNEWEAHPFNNVDRAAFNKIDGVISVAGSMGPTGGMPMPPPQWDMCDYHPPRTYPNTVVDMCLANHPSRLQEGKAMMVGEPLKFGLGFEVNPRIAREVAGSTRGTGCGAVFHSVSGGFSQLYNSVELDCAHEFFDQLTGT